MTKNVHRKRRIRKTKQQLEVDSFQLLFSHIQYVLKNKGVSFFLILYPTKHIHNRLM